MIITNNFLPISSSLTRLASGLLLLLPSGIIFLGVMSINFGLVSGRFVDELDLVNETIAWQSGSKS